MVMVGGAVEGANLARARAAVRPAVIWVLKDGRIVFHSELEVKGLWKWGDEFEELRCKGEG